ncbi:MAG: hypothetical protein HQK98_08035 [Nitrospirae bacterium]|nr:hypothetical protein [Nitrospirota bacterium]
MIIENKSWPMLKDSLIRVFFNELLLKILIALLTFGAVYLFCEKLNSFLMIRVYINMRSSYDNNPRIYFHNQKGDFDREKLVMAHIDQSEGFVNLKFKIPEEIKDPMVMSLFVGEKEGVIEIKSIRMETLFKRYQWSAAEIMKEFVPNENIAGYELVDGVLRITTKRNTPFISNWNIGGKYEALQHSIDKHYLSYVFGAGAALIAFFILSKKRFPAIDPRGKSIFNISTASVFALFISLPFMSTIFLITYKVNITEQRTLARKPPLKNLEDLARFTEDYTQYYEDNFGFREMLIRWNNEFKVKWLNTSPMQEQVVFGRDGWVYLSALNIINDYKGIKQFTNAELSDIKHTLLERQRWLAKRGMKYYVIIASNKETIYPEYLPDYIRKTGGKTRAEQLMEYMDNSTVTIINVKDALVNAKPGGQLFHKTDTHWNSYGAFWAYRKVMETMGFPGSQPMDISEFSLHKKYIKGGDLYKLLSLSDLYTDEDVIFHHITPYRSVLGKPGDYANPCWDPNTPIVVKEIDDKRLPKVVVFRDSFFINMLHYFSEHFQRSVFLWTMTFDKDIIEKEHPDIVVTEFVERDIDRLGDKKIRELTSPTTPDNKPK